MEADPLRDLDLVKILCERMKSQVKENPGETKVIGEFLLGLSGDARRGRVEETFDRVCPEGENNRRFRQEWRDRILTSVPTPTPEPTVTPAPTPTPTPTPEPTATPTPTPRPTPTAASASIPEGDQGVPSSSERVSPTESGGGLIPPQPLDSRRTALPAETTTPSDHPVESSESNGGTNDAGSSTGGANVPESESGEGGESQASQLEDPGSRSQGTASSSEVPGEEVDSCGQVLTGVYEKKTSGWRVKGSSREISPETVFTGKPLCREYLERTGLVEGNQWNDRIPKGRFERVRRCMPFALSGPDLISGLPEVDGECAECPEGQKKLLKILDCVSRNKKALDQQCKEAIASFCGDGGGGP